MVNVKSGSVTYAVRDTHIDGMEIKSGDFMGLDDHTIKSTGKDLITVSTELIDSMIDDASELVSIYYGEDSNEEDAQKVADAVSARYKMVDVEVHPGNQPVYYFVISVE